MQGKTQTLADQRVKRALDGYREAFHNSTASAFWGIELDGVKAIFRPSSTRLFPLIGITFRVCCFGLTTAALLSSLAGSWISIFLVRRRMMSCVNLIFDAISPASATGGQIIRLSPELVDELLTCCLLGSMCWTNLRACTNGCIRATDASDWAMAGVVSKVDAGLCREFLRRSLVW